MFLSQFHLTFDLGDLASLNPIKCNPKTALGRDMICLSVIRDLCHVQLLMSKPCIFQTPYHASLVTIEKFKVNYTQDFKRAFDI